MKIILFISLFINLSMFASTSVKTLTFESGISVYGKVGIVNLRMQEDTIKHTYKMEVNASSSGLVKILTSNRREFFVSEGFIKDSVYMPVKFTKRTLKNNYERVTTYIFDYKKEQVLKKRVVWEDETVNTLDIVSMKIKTTKKRKIKEKYTQTIKLYANDFLTLYLNMQKGNLKKGEVNYVDMNEKDSLFLVSKNDIEVHKHNGRDKYNIKIFYDEKSLFFKKAVSVDIAFYGDAYIKKISEKSM